MALVRVRVTMKDLHDSFLRFEPDSLSPSQIQIINDIGAKLAEITQLLVQLDGNRESNVQGTQVGKETARPDLNAQTPIISPDPVLPTYQALGNGTVPHCTPVVAVSDATTPQPSPPTIEPIPIDTPRPSSAIDSVPALSCPIDEWREFPQVLNRASQLGAEEFGAFKVALDVAKSWQLRRQGHVPCNGYAAEPNANGTFRIFRKDTRQKLLWSETPTADVESILQEQMNRLKNGIPGVFYRTDVRAATRTQRLSAGLISDSLVWPLRGDKLTETKHSIPGIHTPYFYQSGSAPGAVFAMHIEDAKLYSINILHKGRKIWIIIPPRARRQFEERLREDNPDASGCSQFVRHLSIFIPVSKLTEWEIPFFVIDQRAGDAIVTFEDTYHEGFCVGPTAAEAVNYAAKDWTVKGYVFCSRFCPKPHINEIDLTIPATDTQSASTPAVCRKLAARRRGRAPGARRGQHTKVAPNVQDVQPVFSCSDSMLYPFADEKYQQALNDMASIQVPQKARIIQLIMQCSAQCHHEAAIDYGPSETEKVISRVVKTRQNVAQYTIALRHDYMKLASIFAAEINRVADQRQYGKAIRRREANYGLRSRRKRGKSGTTLALESMLGCNTEMSPSDLSRCVRWGNCLTELCAKLGSRCLMTFPGINCADLAASLTSAESHFPDLLRPITPEE